MSDDGEDGTGRTRADLLSRYGDEGGDAEERFGDPESDLPTVPEAPTVRDYSQVDADGDTTASFWTAVVYANVALFLVVVGPALALVQGWTTVGAVLFVLGLLGFVRVYSIVVAYRRRRREREEEQDRERERDRERDGGAEEGPEGTGGADADR
ncbi:MAG: hypothetical protein ABEJ85_00855 [Haloarculaceae archaeon]